MHDAIQPATGEFQKECELISRIFETSPRTADIANFYSSNNHGGKYSWKYDRDRMLDIRWEGKNLIIHQTLTVNGITKGVDFPVTWGTEKNPILFNGEGVTKLPESASHEFWCALTGIQDWAHISHP